MILVKFNKNVYIAFRLELITQCRAEEGHLNNMVLATKGFQLGLEDIICEFKHNFLQAEKSLASKSRVRF